MRRFFRRLSVVPFEAAIGALAFYSGLVGLLHISRSSDALNLLLPAWAVIAFQVAYLWAGLSLVYGAGRGKTAPEVTGLLLLATSILVRSVALFWFLGWDQLAFQSVAPNAVFLAACIARYRSLSKGITLIRAQE